jgi:hypothetical protein
VLHRSYGVGLHQVWLEKVTKVSRIAGKVLVAFWKRCAGATPPYLEIRGRQQSVPLLCKRRRGDFRVAPCDGARSLPVRICDADLSHAASHHRTHTPDLEENIVASHHNESRAGMDLAPHRIAADTKIVRQREVHHFRVEARATV